MHQKNFYNLTYFPSRKKKKKGFSFCLFFSLWMPKEVAKLKAHFLPQNVTHLAVAKIWKFSYWFLHKTSETDWKNLVEMEVQMLSDLFPTPYIGMLQAV